MLTSTQCFESEAALREHILLHVAPVLSWCSDDLLAEVWHAALSTLNDEEQRPGNCSLRGNIAGTARQLVNRGKLESLLPQSAAMRQLQVCSCAYTQLLVCLGLAVFDNPTGALADYLNPAVQDLQVLVQQGTSVAAQVCTTQLLVLHWSPACSARPLYQLRPSQSQPLKR